MIPTLTTARLFLRALAPGAAPDPSADCPSVPTISIWRHHAGGAA